jgi:hypothetical protein
VGNASGKRTSGVPPIHCGARCKTSRRHPAGEPCWSWAVVGTTRCRMHGGVSGQVIMKANVELTIRELIDRDPRPIRAVLTDAVHLADACMKDQERAAVPDVSRLLESTRYVVAVATAALSHGLRLDHEPRPGLVSADAAYRAVVEQTMAMVGDLVGVLLPLRSHPDVVYRDALLAWCRDRMAAVMRGEPSPPMPEAPVEAVVTFGGRESPPSPPSSVVDAETVPDESQDPGDDAGVPESGSLNEREAWAEVVRLRRGGSLAARSVWP